MHIIFFMLLAFCYPEIKSMEYIEGGMYAPRRQPKQGVILTGIKISCPPGGSTPTITANPDTNSVKISIPTTPQSTSPGVINVNLPSNINSLQVLSPSPDTAVHRSYTVPFPQPPVAAQLPIAPASQLITQQSPQALPQQLNTTGAQTPSMQEIFNSFSQLPTTCIQFIRSHPYITAGVSVVALSYSYLLYRCWYIKRYLAQTNTWSGWNIQVPLEVLKSKVQEEVADILMADIKAHYQITAGAYDLMRALLIFKGEVDTELKKLNTYKALIEYLDGSYIQAVLPDLRPLKIGLTERIQRILYLKDILYTWLHTNNRSLRASHELL